MGKLDGKVALITGGSSGIGFATAEELLSQGAYIFITGRRKEALDVAVEKLGNKNVTAIQADSSKLTDLDNVVNIIKEKKGRLHILFVNAGIAELSPIGSITEQNFNNHFNINVKGVLFTVQKSLPIFVDGGSIIIVGSCWSIQGISAASVYSATKAAIRSFARCWTMDLKDRKIRVNTLSPGATDTPMLRHVGDTEENTEKILNSIGAISLMGRLGKPLEIAKAALFLASDDSSYITGIELFVDGGMAQL